jgi:MOSC domain-containing protein YiiM
MAVTPIELVPHEMRGRIFQLNASNGGVPKRSVREAVLTMTGLVGDRQAKADIHGGPERALCLYSLERILELQAEGNPIFPGSAGENLTVSGLQWERLAPGVTLAAGDEVVIQISSYTSPCKTISGSFVDGQFSRISQNLRPGDSRLYASVLRPGRLAVGQEIKVIVGEMGKGGRG